MKIHLSVYLITILGNICCEETYLVKLLKQMFIAESILRTVIRTKDKYYISIFSDRIDV